MAWRVHRTVCDLGVLCSSSGSVSCGVTSWGHSWSPFVVHSGWPEDLYAYELPRLLAALNFLFIAAVTRRACATIHIHWSGIFLWANEAAGRGRGRRYTRTRGDRSKESDTPFRFCDDFLHPHSPSPAVEAGAESVKTKRAGKRAPKRSRGNPSVHSGRQPRVRALRSVPLVHYRVPPTLPPPPFVGVRRGPTGSELADARERER